MGQMIGIIDHSEVDDVLMVNADRSFSGQDGETYSTAPENPATFPGQLAVRLFEVDPAINHIYVMSNTVALRRTGGWDESSISQSTDAISTFFRFYPD
ncbi:MAG: hypothetical protein ABR609_03400 [Acidimicrobiia bacterium]